MCNGGLGLRFRGFGGKGLIAIRPEGLIVEGVIYGSLKRCYWYDRDRCDCYWFASVCIV